MASCVFSLYPDREGKVGLDYPVCGMARLTIIASSLDEEEDTQGCDLLPSELRLLAKQLLIAAREIEHGA